ncbi:accessory Sec system glycosylation chaperone GtfB [Lactobacillus gallinarum]|uniref:accessory Sec system glycosylation chaperone GtfB n=1 Tax=Lactobacillus gallinarum TaxID=52242 RepID=UPI00388EF324
MINLFENFNADSADLLRSELYAKINIPSVAIHDNGFLPEEIDSPIKFYCGFRKEGHPLYFDKVPLPKYWRIEATGQNANVYDLNHKRAEIIYNSTDNTREVTEVRWLDDNGAISWIEHYNNVGQLFAKTFYNQGKATLRKYFNQSGKEVIVQNLEVGDIFLNYRWCHKHFANIAEFVVFYLKERKYNLDHIFYNTLNESLSVSLGVDTAGGDIMLWHEPTGNALPGNMDFLMKTKTRTKYIFFQNYREWQKSKSLIPEDTGNVKFDFFGMVYPHPRSNQLRRKALIMTNSDQIEHLKEVVEAMPDIEFNIAAVTTMSDKLLAFKKYANVKVYPNVSRKKTVELFNECDVYFDINHQNEILNSVRIAFEQNMLIVGFNNTLHQPKYISEKAVFAPDNVQGMKELVETSLNDRIIMKDNIDYQRKMAGDISVDEFKKTFEKCTK